VRSLWSSSVLSAVSGHPLYCLQSLGHPLYCLQSLGHPLYCLKSLVIFCTVCILCLWSSSVLSALSSYPLYCLQSLGHPLYCLQSLGHPLYCLQSLGHPLYCLKSLVIFCTVCILWSSPILSAVSGHPCTVCSLLVIPCTVCSLLVIPFTV
ncbi:unnamed protein product, partial [Staurois parvus]